MTTPIKGHLHGTSAPAHRFRAVTPHDTEEVPQFRALYIGTGGDVRVINADGDDEVFKAPDGAVVPVEGVIVHTDTTADHIIALY